MSIVALHNIKGGVGKSTTAVHLAHLQARAGRRTLLWDLDPQGAASWCFRVRPVDSASPRRLLGDGETLWGALRGSDWPSLDVLPADLSMRKLEEALRRAPAPEEALAGALAELGKHYERIVLDCPPGLSLLSECIFGVADALVVPTIPSALSLRTLAALYGHVKPHRSRGLLVLPFFSMVDARKAQHRVVREYARANELGFLATEIPFSVQVENVAARREPLTATSTQGPAAAFEALRQEIEGRLASRRAQPKLHPRRLQEFVLGLGQAARQDSNGAR